MGLVKKIAKGMKHIARNPFDSDSIKAGLASVAGPVGAAIGYGKLGDSTEDEARRRSANTAIQEQNMAAFGYGSLEELINAKKKKEAELEQRNRGTTGLSSLIGGGGNTLG